jgi:hypothetical protein
VQIERKGGGYGQSCPSSSSRYRIETEKGTHRGDLPAADGGRPGHGGGWEWGEWREEVEGDSFLSSPRAGAACGGRSMVAGGL